MSIFIAKLTIPPDRSFYLSQSPQSAQSLFNLNS